MSASATEPEAQPAAQDEDAPVAEGSEDPAEALRREARAQITSAWEALAGGCTKLACADLADAAAVARARWKEAEAQAAEAEAAATGPRAEAEAWAAKLADAQNRLSNLRTATADDDLTVQIEAESLIVAAERVVERVAARLAEAQEALAPADSAVAAARAEAGRAETECAAYAEAAVSGPLAHPLGHSTAGYEEWIRHTWPMVLAAGDPAHPDWKAARRHLFRVLRTSGLGAQIAQDIITERDAESGVNPYRPILGPDGKRQGWLQVPRTADLANLPARPQTDTTPGADVAAQMHHALGWGEPGWWDAHPWAGGRRD